MQPWLGRRFDGDRVRGEEKVIAPTLHSLLKPEVNGILCILSVMGGCLLLIVPGVDSLGIALTCALGGFVVGLLHSHLLRRNRSSFARATTLVEVQRAFREGTAGRIASAATVLSLAPGGWLGAKNGNAWLFLGGVGVFMAVRLLVLMPAVRGVTAGGGDGEPSH